MSTSGDVGLLTVRGVSKSYGGLLANDDISLQVERGSITGIIGPNGSGKSTLFNAICGSCPIDGGQIFFDGHEITRDTSAEIARAGLIRTFQQTRIYKDMTCLDNMRISAPPPKDEGRRHWLQNLPPSIDSEAMDLLSFVGLAEKSLERAGALSFGQQKLLELAMALIARPLMLLLDEPTAGINPTLINGVLARLRTVNEKFGVTLLVIEHNMRVMMNLATHIYCLAHGRMLAEGDSQTIQNDPRVINAYLGRQ